MVFCGMKYASAATEVAAAEPELGAAMSRRIRGYNYLGLLDLLGDGSTHGEETE